MPRRKYDNERDELLELEFKLMQISSTLRRRGHTDLAEEIRRAALATRENIDREQPEP